MLTLKQRNLLLFIHEKLQENGVAPSFDEMKDALNLKSKSGIHRLIKALEERDFIRRLPNRARALEILRLPDNEAETSSRSGPAVVSSTGSSRLAGSGHDITQDKIQDNVFRPNFEKKSIAAANIDPQTVEIPLHGKIAAGTPIEALEQYENLTIPISMIGSGSHYALEIDGDSMMEAGILDGDTIIIKRCETAENGTIVVALIDEQEATLKTLYKRGPDIELEPSNRDFKTLTYAANRIRIQGRLVGLLRQY